MGVSREGRKRKYCRLISCKKTSNDSTLPVFQLPPKPQTLQGYASKVDRKKLQTSTPSKSSTLAETPKPAAPRRPSTQKTQRTPQVNVISHWIHWLTEMFFFILPYGRQTKWYVCSVEWWLTCHVAKDRRRRDLLSRKEKTLREIDR